MKRACTHAIFCRAILCLAIFCLALFTPFCVPSLALDPSLDVSQYAHTAWRIREGFAKGEIHSIAQTPDGYLWLGTEFGLLRFDGVRTVPWQPPAGQHLPSNQIWSVTGARDGTLWIGTANGLASWKNGKLTQYAELAGKYVFTILEDRDGTTWAGAVGVPAGKLCAIQHSNVHCAGDDGSLGGGVLGLYEDSKGNLWVGVRDGVWRWKPGSAKFYSLPRQLNGIRALAEDADGSLLIGMHDGIHRLVGEKAELAYPIPSNGQLFEPESLLRDSDGGLWITTKRHGLAHLHQGKTDTFTQADGLSGAWSNRIFEDREGNIWVETTDGLDRFRGYMVTTLTAHQGLSDTNVHSVLADKNGSVWLSTISGLNRWNAGQITTYRGGSRKPDGKLNGEDPHSLFQDTQGRIWVSTHAAIGYLDKDRFVPVTGATNVHGIAEDAAGSLWIADLERGLLRLAQNSVVQQIPVTALGHQDFISALAADRSDGGSWLGFFNGGIAHFDGESTRASYSTANGLAEGQVSDIRLDHNGTLWVATEGGLSRLKDGRFATLSGKNGLPCDGVHWTIEDDDHYLWLYMPCGLARIVGSELEAAASAVEKDKNAKPTIQFALFDSSDGVRSRADAGGYVPHVTKSLDGKLWFVAGEGVSVIDPQHLPFNKLPPPVHIERITAEHKIFHATPDSNGQMQLPPLIRDLQIDYTALSLVAPEKVLFRYKLEGWDRDWQDVGTRRQAFYNNLPPRNYTFRVMACNNSGVWNEAGAFLGFSIAPAYYQTWWFRSLCVLAFLAMVYGAYRVRIGQLRAQEEKFRETIESIPAMAFVSRPDGYRTFVNKGWVEYTGMTVEQSLGSGWHAAIHPEDLKQVLDKWEKSLATGESIYYEARYRRAKDGQYRWFMVRVVGQRDKRGKIVKWFGTVTDVEDRKRAEESLQSSEAYLVEAQSLTHTGSCAIDGTSRETLYWSDEMFRLFGFDPQRGLPMFDQWLQRIHPEDRDNVKLASERTFLTKVKCDLEFRIVKPDGTVKHIHGIGHPVVSATGELVQVLGTMVDVTERKRADQKFRGLLESAPDAMVVMDRQGQILLVNAQAERLFGYKREELLGQDVVILMPERFRGRHSLRRTEYFAHPRVWSMGQNLELYARRSDGTEFPVEISLSPLETEEGTLVSGALRDITERKHAEQEREKLRRLEDDLAHINRVSVLGEMAASLAHEIKQPIAAAITSANTCMEWLAHEPPNLDRARAAASRIDKYGNRAATIIERIRSLYKKSPSQRELVDVNDIIHEMLTLLKFEADRCSVAMNTELAADLPKIVADRVQLQQVLMNLILNGIEAMADSGGELSVRSQRQDSQLLLSVSDTGVGVAPEKMEQIFSAFFTTKPQGSGMGLAICRSIVESHGGRLWASSNDGPGATFHFSLPIATHIVEETATGT